MGVLIGGPTPQDGKSAYQLAVDNGFVGTLNQWLASLIGAAGPAGPAGSSGNSPIGTILFGAFDLNKFAGSGLGNFGTDVEGFALADGRNGTVDMRGFVPGGGLNYGAGALHAAVDPAAHLNDPDYQKNVGAWAGEVKHKITVSELPKIQPTVNDPGHKHFGAAGILAGNVSGGAAADGGSSFTIKRIDTEQAGTGITINQFGGDMPMNNLQPTRYLVFIQKIS